MALRHAGNIPPACHHLLEHGSEYCNTETLVFHLHSKLPFTSIDNVMRELLLKTLASRFNTVIRIVLKPVADQFINAGCSDNLMKSHRLPPVKLIWMVLERNTF